MGDHPLPVWDLRPFLASGERSTLEVGGRCRRGLGKVVDMNTSKYLPYAVAGLIAVGIAVWAGVPAFLLLVLVCPVMMFFMMGSMSGGITRDNDTHDGPAEGGTSQPLDGSHDRIDQP